MAEYIEREALREILDGWRDAHADVDDVHGCGLLEDVICEVDAQTAADVAPVVHAEWVVCGDGDNVPWMCSHCGKTTAHKYKVIYGKYCPHCWAKMDGGADNDTN